jgi:hypothetical protein
LTPPVLLDYATYRGDLLSRAVRAAVDVMASVQYSPCGRVGHNAHT